MKITILPLEPLDKRYTQQWFKWFPEVMSKRAEVRMIGEDFSDTGLTPGWFWDMKKSFMWKCKQLEQVIPLLENTDWVFVMDFEFPGLEVLEYMRKIYKLNFKIASYVHAATYVWYDPITVAGLTRIGKDLEEVWLDISDLVFVQTYFAKRILVERRRVEEDKVLVVGVPLDVEYLKTFRRPFNEKDIDVVWCGRPAYDKGYDIYLQLKDEFNIVSTFDKDLTKEEFYQMLARAKVNVSFSREDNFGIAIMEGAGVGTFPLVPKGLSYDELLPVECRYHSIEQLRNKIAKIVKESYPMNQFDTDVERFDYSKVIDGMLDRMSAEF